MKLQHLVQRHLHKTITFTNTQSVDEMYAPEPATKNIPDWYKRTSNRIGEKKEPSSVPTIKKCVPVFDAMSMGYYLVTSADVYVKQTDDGPEYIQSQNSAYQTIDFRAHPLMQASKHPDSLGLQVFPKWINSWAIKTPKGYSTLFVAPMHNPNPYFEAFPGCVDTDTYSAPVNFPFQLKDPKFEGLIPAGTPIVQVIPFKRDEWKSVISNDVEPVNKIVSKLNSQMFDRYKRLFWSRKEYR
jgi:hypothetical protein